MADRDALVQCQGAEREQLKADWAKRSEDRKAVWERFRAIAPSPVRTKPEFDAATGRTAERSEGKDAARQRLIDRYDRAARTGAPAREQDNSRDRGDRER